MLKFLKLLLGLFLLPLAASMTLVFMQQFPAAESLRGLARTTYWFIGGFVTWLVLFAMFPRPLRTYVLGHELTHALWGMLMGARVSKLRVSSRGGSVNLTKTNVWITLAPYFFPFYMVLALFAYLIAEFFWDTSLYLPFWYAVFGLTWAFHLTFTVAMLAIHQPDIHEHGRIFSYTLIYCINLATAALLLHQLAGLPLRELAQAAWQQTLSTYLATGDLLIRAYGQGSKLIAERLQ